MTTADAVILDIGNVLIEWNPARLFDRVMPPADRARMFDEVDLDAMNRAIDLGAPFRETVYGAAERHPKWARFIRLWHDRWIEMATPEIPESRRLMQSLRRRGVPVHALSNFGVDSLLIAEAHYPFLTEFDRRFISGHLGVMKPDPAIYTLVEDAVGLPPGRLLFADDRPENVAAARARGWQAHIFEGSSGWAARLVAAGLLSEEEAQA